MRPQIRATLKNKIAVKKQTVIEIEAELKKLRTTETPQDETDYSDELTAANKLIINFKSTNSFSISLPTST